jgi:hypothetical protein
MAAALPADLESGATKGGDALPAGDPRQAAHTAMS